MHGSAIEAYSAFTDFILQRQKKKKGKEKSQESWETPITHNSFRIWKLEGRSGVQDQPLQHFKFKAKRGKKMGGGDRGRETFHILH